ncbi:hypothetical protein HDU83_008755 [Entophlyctis luteolus]|nr:hypothetical protein HDU82_003478 [Entophlyctis luteolus]KAJ3351728.1 hypothetical protein HDU83_008755 [Entophlyctis luteolus]KAJ3390688.1 hypothetical protein HDU84_007090 [Entophlyctis sp. JEL0112]
MTVGKKLRFLPRKNAAVDAPTKRRGQTLCGRVIKAVATAAVALLAVVAASDLIKLANHTEEAMQQPVLFLPLEETLVLWDIACLQLLHVPTAWLRALGCSILPNDERQHSLDRTVDSALFPGSIYDATPHGITGTSRSSTGSASILHSDLHRDLATSGVGDSSDPSLVTASDHNTPQTTASASALSRTMTPTKTMADIYATTTVAEHHVSADLRTKVPPNADTNTGAHGAKGIPCIFCRISESPAEKSRLVYEDDRFVGFHDINPSARVHVLIVPKDHIGTSYQLFQSKSHSGLNTESVMNLTHKDLPLLRDMKLIGHNILAKNFDIPIADHHLGFHVPPFTSVPHLHLHAIGRPFKNWVRSAKYPEMKGWWTGGDSAATGSALSGVFGKGRWIRWWVEVSELIATLEAARERDDFRTFSWSFFQH